MEKPSVYQIRVRGHISNEWAQRFDGFIAVREEGSATVLTGPVTDQAALYAVLKRVQTLGMTLISVNKIQQEEE